MICFPLDDIEYEAKEMGAYLATRTRGVFSAEDNLRVSPGQSGLTVTVAPGLAWLKWSDWWGVAALQDTALTFTLDKADGTLSRMDAIVARLDKTGNRAEIAVKKGSFSSAPTVADPVRDDSADEIYLATVLVEPGAVSLTAAAITDQRLNETYCGLMRDGVTGIPTAALQNQVQQLIDELRRVISGIEAGSEVMLKTVYAGSGPGIVAMADKANESNSAQIANTLEGKTLAQIVPKYTAAETAMPYAWLDGKTVYRTVLQYTPEDFIKTEQGVWVAIEEATRQIILPVLTKTGQLNQAASILPMSCACVKGTNGGFRPISYARPEMPTYAFGWRLDKEDYTWTLAVSPGELDLSSISKLIFVIYYTK